jgi:tight adherence protein C
MALSLAATFSVMGGILLFFIGLRMSRKKPQTASLILQSYAARPPSLEELELQRPFSERFLKPIIEKLSGVMAARTPQSTLDSIRTQLELAGNPNNLTVADFLGIKGFGALIAGGLAFLVTFNQDMSIIFKLLAPLIGAYIGQMLPNLWLNGKITARSQDIQDNLPDAMDLLTIAVEAGMGFEGAISKVVEKWDNALTQEFGRFLREQRMGVSRRDALRNMALRSNVPDLSSFVAAIIQADQLGVSIARVLSVQSDQMRVKRRQRAEKLAAQAPLKMTFPMVLFMMPSLWIVILGPIVPLVAEMGRGG